METLKSNSRFPILTGPSGRAIAQDMEASLVDALQQHLTMERQASANYLCFEMWFAERELRGFSNFFSNESRDEIEHARTFSKYLIARGQTVRFEELQAPPQNLNTVEEIISYSFQMEADVTTSLHLLYSKAERASDMRTTVFLDPTIEKQTESEDEFAYILGKVKFADNQPAALLIIDDELKQK